MKRVSTIETLKVNGKASLEINAFKKRESKLIKDALAEGFEFEVIGTYEKNNNTYVTLAAVK